MRKGERCFQPPKARLEDYHRRRLRQTPDCLPTPKSRSQVREAIVGVCKFRSWSLFALHVRTNHVHGVLEIGVRCTVGAGRARRTDGTVPCRGAAPNPAVTGETGRADRGIVAGNVDSREPASRSARLAGWRTSLTHPRQARYHCYFRRYRVSYVGSTSGNLPGRAARRNYAAAL